MNSNRCIVHLDLDTFFVSVERLIDPRLVKRPILVGSLSARGVVAACSYEARHYGIRSGMPMQWAVRLCPKAIVVKGDYDRYSNFSYMITQIIQENAPVFEKTSIDEFYMDLSGMDKFVGCFKWSNELRAKIIKETRLPLSFGLASNKTIAKIGSNEAKPNGRIHINKGKEIEFLSPFPIRKIPGIGHERAKRLNLLGVQQIIHLREIPKHWLEREFGLWGNEIYWKSRGVDYAPVQPYEEQESISQERTLDSDTTDLMLLQTIIKGMIERLTFDLRCKNKLCSCLTVKIKYADFQTQTKQKKIFWTADDKYLQDQAIELLTHLFQRRVFVRLVGIKLSHLVNGKPQLALFEKNERDWQLLKAMDKIRARFGNQSVSRANTIIK